MSLINNVILVNGLFDIFDSSTDPLLGQKSLVASLSLGNLKRIIK